MARHWDRVLRAPGVGRDVLAEYRDRIMLPMSTTACAALVPFMVFDWFMGRRLLAVMILGVIVPVLFDTWALWHRRRPPVAYGWLMLPVAGAIGAAMLTHGVLGALWCYPAILFCYFVLPGWQATAGALGLLALTSVLVERVLGVPTMLRFVVSAGLSIGILNIVLCVVGELQRKLVAQATTDPLTGALNRRQLAGTLEDAMAQSARSGQPVTLLAFDLDHFKDVNDRYGHAAGDAVLQRVVGIVRERARRIDRLFRMGGEEFALLLPGAGPDEALRFAESLRERIALAGGLGGPEVTVSIGLAGWVGAQTQDEWLKAADDALYAAKSGGRNRVCTAPPVRLRGVPARPVAVRHEVVRRVRAPAMRGVLAADD